MVRTFAPAAMTSAHTSRFATCAVAGMRMPPELRRSPSSVGIFTSTRSFSILIGSFASPGIALTRRTVPSRVVARETTVLDTADAIALEAEIDVPPDRWAGVVLAHPHPTYGGNMHANVTDALFEALPRQGIATVRFNFRGVGAS